MGAEQKVLIIDDNRMSRTIAAKALGQMGLVSVEVESGPEALEAMKRQDFDLVLLDIEMPGMDGLDVLRAMRAPAGRLTTPVLVISGHRDDMAVVAAAIELGADDFLPKPFDGTLSRARVTSCLEKKRLRDAELDNLRQIDKLTGAAQIMESGRFRPESLKLETLATRPDAMGRLALVFLEMAHQVYDRELALQRNVRTLKGGALLLLQGVLWGLVVPLSIIIYRENQLTMGVTFWSNIVAGLLCCGLAVASGKSLRVNKSELLFLLSWALIFGISSIVLFEVAGRVSGIALSIIIALQGFAVFTIAAVMRIEAPSLRRFAGLGVGLIGVIALLLAREKVTGVDDWVWLLIAVLVPILYAAIDILLAVKHPPSLDSIVSSGLVLVLSGLLVLPLALIRGQYFTLWSDISLGDILVAVTGLCIGICTVLYIRLIALAGAVFASQSAYAITLAGIGWSVVLLGERLTLWTAIALALVVVGLALVGPKREAGNVEVEFRRKARVAPR